MLIDKSLRFGGAEATLIGTASTRYPLQGASKGLDCTKAGDNPGPGELELVIQIGATAVATAGGAANITFSLETKADTGAGEAVDNAAATWTSTPGTVLWKSAAIPKATLVAGYTVCRIRLPKGLLRYFDVVSLPDTSDITAGTVNAYLTPAAQYNVQ